VGRELEWVRPRLLKSTYELRDGRRAVATLAFRSSWGTLATAEFGDGCWTFKRTGVFRMQVSVRACGSDTNLAVFRPRSWKGGGRLDLPGRPAILASANVWRSRHEFTVRGQPVVRVRTRQRLTLGGRVEVLPAAADLADAAFLVPLGWYLIVLMHRDNAVVATF
jgi:hypothetical protein